MIGIVSNQIADIRFPLQLESGIMMCGFTELGVLCSHGGWKQKITKIGTKTMTIGILLCTALGCIVSNINGFCEVRIYAYGKFPFLFIVSSCLLGMAVILIAVLLRKNKFLQLFGKNTLIILCIHKFPVVFFQKICPVIKDVLKEPETILGSVTACGISIVIILMCYIAKVIIDRCENKISNYIIL